MPLDDRVNSAPIVIDPMSLEDLSDFFFGIPFAVEFHYETINLTLELELLNHAGAFEEELQPRFTLQAVSASVAI